MNAFPELVINDILPLVEMPRPVNVIRREAKPENLLAQLAVHRRDVVYAGLD